MALVEKTKTTQGFNNSTYSGQSQAELELRQASSYWDSQESKAQDARYKDFLNTNDANAFLKSASSVSTDARAKEAYLSNMSIDNTSAPETPEEKILRREMRYDDDPNYRPSQSSTGLGSFLGDGISSLLPDWSSVQQAGATALKLANYFPSSIEKSLITQLGRAVFSDTSRSESARIKRPISDSLGSVNRNPPARAYMYSTNPVEGGINPISAATNLGLTALKASKMNKLQLAAMAAKAGMAAINTDGDLSKAKSTLFQSAGRLSDRNAISTLVSATVAGAKYADARLGISEEVKGLFSSSPTLNQPEAKQIEWNDLSEAERQFRDDASYFTSKEYRDRTEDYGSIWDESAAESFTPNRDYSCLDDGSSFDNDTYGRTPYSTLKAIDGMASSRFKIPGVISSGKYRERGKDQSIFDTLLTTSIKLGLDYTVSKFMEDGRAKNSRTRQIASRTSRRSARSGDIRTLTSVASALGGGRMPNTSYLLRTVLSSTSFGRNNRQFIGPLATVLGTVANSVFQEGRTNTRQQKIIWNSTSGRHVPRHVRDDIFDPDVSTIFGSRKVDLKSWNPDASSTISF